MWLKWLPWKFILKKVARSKGFIDPMLLLSRLSRFAQPSEVWAPVELLRAGAVFHARGLINSHVIQHNLDWVWPYWVERQFDPSDQSFIPRAFSLTQINLTHRNWTAVGIPGFDELPIVDPHGLVMPFFDSWSVDCWVILANGAKLLPSRTQNVSQTIEFSNSLEVVTKADVDGISLKTQVKTLLQNGIPTCHITVSSIAPSNGWLVLALRPYNPEGISFVHRIQLFKSKMGWSIDKDHAIFFDQKPDYCRFSNYMKGDVYHWVLSSSTTNELSAVCDVGMATAMAAYSLKADNERTTSIQIPLVGGKKMKKLIFPVHATAQQVWCEAYEDCCRLQFSFHNFQFLYENAVRTLLLHTPSESYAGPYTYKRFWFRDAAFIINALLCAGLVSRAERVIESFFSRQTADGYFLSQDGEWDSNGEALWSIMRFCQVSGRKAPDSWKSSIIRGADWIVKKRVLDKDSSVHHGLFPAGFSAEHLGPNDFYYWDDFWGVAGLKAASFVLIGRGESECAQKYIRVSAEFSDAIDRSLHRVAGANRRPIMPASPYRRPDSGAVGSLAAGYPLQLFEAGDERLQYTADYLFRECLIGNAFYHDIIHSGINPYLSLHIAQVLLRGGDSRFRVIMEAIAGLASPTGQWPEAIHPSLKTGCMGDGQHAWAAAEWTLMVRNCFIREEPARSVLVLCSGIYHDMFFGNEKISFGPAPTSFGIISLELIRKDEKIQVRWDAKWHDGKKPLIEISFPGKSPILIKPENASGEVSG